ncbi:DUF6894 family protein [Phenylobacterium sp.]|uniref:DUF6894 family protein n=1 Tax=Phenylobacterium sp. TaxID=1871053 RepID=UPI0039C9917F
MPLYHLHIRDAQGTARDDEGVEFADLEAARKEALNGARSLMAADLLKGALDPRGYIEIADESGRTVDVVRFRDSFTFVEGDQLEAEDSTGR